MIQYAATQSTLPAVTHRSRGCTRSIVERIADVICEAAGSGQVLTMDVFESHDIPAAVVQRYAGPARDCARRRFVKRA